MKPPLPLHPGITGDVSACRWTGHMCTDFVATSGPTTYALLTASAETFDLEHLRFCPTDARSRNSLTGLKSLGSPVS